IVTQAASVHTLRQQRTQLEAKAPDPKKAQLPPARTNAAIQPTAPRQPVAPAVEHKQPAALPAEHIQPATPATEHKQPVAPASAVKVEPVAPAPVYATPPDRVTIQPTHVVGKPAVSGVVGKTPPARPADEHRAPAEVKEPRPAPPATVEHKAPAAPEAKDARKDEPKTKKD
ncbi:MAG: hypothetical protein ABSH20_25140, partial [Tepidisphaeraceae bacterium]